MMNDRGGGRGVMVMIVLDIEGELLDWAPLSFFSHVVPFMSLGRLRPKLAT